MKDIKNKFLNLYKEILNVLRKPVVSVLPGHLSFFLLLSSIPIIIIICMIAKTFSLSYDNLIDFVTKSLPAGTSRLILPLFNTPKPNISYFFLVVSAFYLASRGTKSIILTSNNIYGVKRNAIQDFVKSIILTFMVILLMIFLSITLVLGEKILSLISSVDALDFVSKNMIDWMSLFRWPISFLFIFISIRFIYILTPNKKIKRKSVTKGSLFTTVSWIVITFIYSFYMTNYASYDTYYGNASNIIILMLWVFIISQLFVIGMIINSIEDKKLSKIE